jgi:hypothetical protein
MRSSRNAAADAGGWNSDVQELEELALAQRSDTPRHGTLPTIHYHPGPADWLGPLGEPRS